MKGKELVEEMVERCKMLNIPSDAVLASQSEEVTFSQSKPAEDISIEAPTSRPKIKVRDEGILDELMSPDADPKNNVMVEIPSGLDDSVISC